jgi:hypothetical protein
VNISEFLGQTGTDIAALCYSPPIASFGFLPESFGSVPKSTFPPESALAGAQKNLCGAALESVASG